MAISFENKTPGQLADDLLKLVGEYGKLSDELGVLYRLKDLNWQMLRDTVKSDRQADQAWFSTEQGSREKQIELILKKIQKQMTAIKTYLQVKSDEARNLT